MLRNLSAGLVMSLVMVPVGSVAAQKPMVSVVSIEVERLQKESGGLLREGMYINLVLTLPDKHILNIGSGSKLESFRDDKNNDLAKAGTSRLDDSATRVSKNGKAIMVSISVKAAPGKGASKVVLKANVAVACGSDVKTDEVKGIDFKENAKGTVGNIKVSITKRFGDQLQIVLTSSAKTIGSVAFTDGDGKEIRGRDAGSGDSGGDKPEYQRYYSLEGKPAKVNVKVTYFDKVEMIRVPVEVEVGVGF